MRTRLALALVLLAASGSAAAQGAALNVITAVEVADEGGSVVLSVKGSKPPNFTTFSMADPPRFVIDLSEARFQGVAEDIQVNDGTILLVKNLSYGSDATSIARVMIAFQTDVEPPDVQATSDSLVVRIAKPAGVPAVAREDGGTGRENAEARAREEAEAARARAEAEAQARAEAEAQARAEVEARAREEAEAQARAEAERAAREEAEALAKAEAERKAQADAEAERARAEAEAQVRAEAERQAQEQARAAAEAQVGAEEAPTATAATEDAEAQARAAVEQAAAREEEARRAKEAYQRERQEALAAAQAEAERQRREEQEAAARARDEARLAGEAEQRRLEAERQARLEEERRTADEARLAQDAEAQRQEEERLAKLAAREEATRAREAERLAADPPSAQLRELGFRQMPGVSRVFVRTSVPPQFTIQDVGDDTIRVELQNTRVARRNDTRFLDTSFFPTAVAMITPSRKGSTYVVDIKLRQRVPYQQRIEGDMLALDFERPGAAPAADAPAADAAGTPAPVPGDLPADGDAPAADAR